ncbi:hypothetical protein KSS87_022256, partial [Heliosperma pusillum]
PPSDGLPFTTKRRPPLHHPRPPQVVSHNRPHQNLLSRTTIARLQSSPSLQLLSPPVTTPIRRHQHKSSTTIALTKICYLSTKILYFDLTKL